MARNKPSTQSSTYESTRMPVPGPRGASLGNSGNVNGFQEWRCCRTNKEANPWWEVDLGHEQPLAGIQIWKGMTYHEQPKNPAGRPPRSWGSSTGREAPSTWVFVSSEPFDRSSDSFAITKESTAVFATEIKPAWDSRTEILHFDGQQVQGRYVRLQQESPLSSLQFAEVEVLALELAAASNIVQRDDGFYGFDSAPGADFCEYVESGWLNPSRDESVLRLWVGSFVEKSPAVQWINTAESSAVAIELKHGRRIGVDEATKTALWESIPVDTTSGPVLDKQSTELHRILEDYKQHHASDLSSFLNNFGGASNSERSTEWVPSLGLSSVLTDEEVTALTSKINTLSCAADSVLLDFGEHKRQVFYVREGSVEVLGPSSSTGVEVLGTVVTGSFFNERSLISQWPNFAATFRAKTPVVCEVIDVAGLRAVLDELRLRAVYEHYIRHGVTGGAKRSGSTTAFTDSTHAQIFRTRVPTGFVSGAPDSNAASLSHRLALDFYACQVDEASGEGYKMDELLGSASLLLSQIDSHGEGDLTLPIFSGSDIVGHVTLNYLVLKPLAHAQNNLSRSWRSYWATRAPLMGGHRGMGRSFYQVDGFRRAETRENTLASLILAGKSGADFVEFDVQLTKDRVPVIYHDFMLNVGLEDDKAWASGTRAEQFEVGIHDLTWRQLTRSWTGPLHHAKKKSTATPHLRDLIKKHWSEILGRSPVAAAKKGAARERAQSLDDDHLADFFPRLRELLLDVPAEIGLNIEIKYPDNFFRTAMRRQQCFAMNDYVDTILRCVFDYAGSRRIFFSCFDASVCVLLRAKQTRYPVLFLTYGSVQAAPFDVRLTLQLAVHIANMERLQGIVSNSTDFIALPELARVTKRALGPRAALITWGDQNTSHDSVQRQKRAGVDGVISDNVLDLARRDRQLLAGSNHQ